MTTAADLADMTDAALGEQFRAAQNALAAAETSTDRASVQEARERLGAIVVELTDPDGRGFIIHSKYTHVGAAVRSGEDLDGVVAECLPDGSVRVDWGREQTPGVPGTRYTRFLASALEAGALWVCPADQGQR